MPVSLVPTNDRIVTSKAPQSAVTAQDVASPYMQLARNLDKIGEVTDTAAVNMAETAGANSVTRGEDGSLVVDKQPIIGPAAPVYARASRMAYLAQAEPEIENKLTELRIRHANDPATFQHAAKAFGEEYVSKISDPTLRGPVEKVIASNAGQNYRGLLAQADATNVSNTQTALKSRISDASNKLADLAFQGGTDTEEYKTLQGNVAAMYGELGGDPRMGYPKARIDSELSQMSSQHKIMAITGQSMKLLDSDSLTARADARKFLIDKIYNDKDLNLSMAQRHQAVTTAMGLMEARSSENKALIEANKGQVNALLTNLRSSQPYNEIAVNDALQNAVRIGDAESYYKLTFAKGMHDWDQTVRALPMPQQIAAGRALDTARVYTGASQQAMEFFQSKGYTREQASGIVGNLIQESGLNPNTVHDNGTGLGIAGHRLERLDAMKAFAASRGKPVNDFQTQLEFIDQELRTTEGATGAALKGARTAQEAARAFISFERPQGWTAANPEAGHGYANRVANAVALSGGSTGAGRAWFEEARTEQVTRFREHLKSQAGEYVDTTVKMLNRAGDVPDAVLQNVADVLRETGRDDLRRKIDTALMAHYGVQDLDKLPESVRQAWVTQSAPQARDNVVSFQVHEAMSTQIEANAKAMKEQPYSTWAARTGGKPPVAYDFQRPDTVGAVATARAGTQATITANDRTGPMSVFEGKEAESFANILDNGEGQAAAQALGGLSSLPTDVYQATLAQKPVAAAVTGMMGSKDPVRMSSAMQAVDKLWRESPADAEATFGKAALTKLQAWQGLRGTFNAAEIAERLNASDDPSTRKAREEARDAAETETKSMTPADMAYKLGSGWPGIGRLTGSTPSAPFDGIKGGELVADYRSTYAALRAYGVDADKASDLAVQRLQSTWGVSAAGGNQVMKMPPEKYYPAIAGSQDWIAKDLNAWIAGRAGPQRSGSRTLEAGIGGAGGSENWTIEGLIADGQTAAEVSAGRPPSYMVSIKKADGTSQILDSRVAFDPTDHVAEHGARLDQRQQSTDFLRSGQFSNAMPLP